MNSISFAVLKLSKGMRPTREKVGKGTHILLVYWTTTECLIKKYTKLIKLNLKLICLTNNMQLVLDSTQSNLNFESSFVRIHQVLVEIWLFKHEF